MADRIDAATRSMVMSRITKKWSQIDRKTHNLLKSAKIRHSMYPKLLGSPDVLIYPNVLVFLDGCFWHCCPKCFRPPKSRLRYWGPKLAGNKRRDGRISRALRKQGWKVIRVWEHEIRTRPRAVLHRLNRASATQKAARHAAGSRSSSIVGPRSTQRRSH